MINDFWNEIQADFLPQEARVENQPRLPNLPKTRSSDSFQKIKNMIYCMCAQRYFLLCYSRSVLDWFQSFWSPEGFIWWLDLLHLIHIYCHSEKPINNPSISIQTSFTAELLSSERNEDTLFKDLLKHKFLTIWTKEEEMNIIREENWYISRFD